MTERQAKWAAQHDWFIDCDSLPDTDYPGDLMTPVVVRVRDVCILPGGEVETSTLDFSNYRELRDWAGY